MHENILISKKNFIYKANQPRLLSMLSSCAGIHHLSFHSWLYQKQISQVLNPGYTGQGQTYPWAIKAMMVCFYMFILFKKPFSVPVKFRPDIRDHIVYHFCAVSAWSDLKHPKKISMNKTDYIWAFARAVFYRYGTVSLKSIINSLKNLEPKVLPRKLLERLMIVS